MAWETVLNFQTNLVLLPLFAGKKFGDVAEDVGQGAFVAGETVRVVFHAGCPRNDIRAGGTFLTGGWSWWVGGRVGEVSHLGLLTALPPSPHPHTHTTTTTTQTPATD